MLIRVEKHPLGRRLHVGPWRIHHWHAGGSLIVLGGWWIYRDRQDVSEAFRRPSHTKES